MVGIIIHYISCSRFFWTVIDNLLTFITTSLRDCLHFLVIVSNDKKLIASNAPGGSFTENNALCTSKY
jgi:hypothetical protein